MTSLFSGGKVTPRPKTAQSPFFGIFIGLGFYGQRIKFVYSPYDEEISALSAVGGVGTGMENHGKYGQFIYTHKGNAVFVNLFVSSELNWREKGVTRKKTSVLSIFLIALGALECRNPIQKTLRKTEAFFVDTTNSR